MRLFLVSAGLLVLTTGLVADDEKPKPRLKQQNPPDLGRLLEQFDKNKDGALDKDEAPERLKERFDQLDENKDGKLTREELRKGMDRFAGRPRTLQPPMPGGGPDALFRGLDSDGDGKLSKDELQAAVKLLERLDRNKDGFLDRAELSGPGGPPNSNQPRPGNPPAADVDRRVAQMLERHDGNKDGKISKEEARGPLADNFDRVDRNKDGFLDKEELRRMTDSAMPPGGTPAPPADVGRRMAEIFERLDANKDGKVSKDEAQGPLADNFDRMDANQDGFLDKDEVRKALERFQPPGGAPGGRPRPTGDAPRAGASFDDLDKNVDGRLTKEELKGNPLADKFDAIDANKDGKIDPKELEAFRSKNAPKDK